MRIQLALGLIVFGFLCSNLAAEDIPGWGVLVDPVGNCPVEFTKTGIAIQVPAGIHDMNPYLRQTNAPRIWQEVAGDFLIEARIIDFPRPQAKTGVNGHQSYIASGILVWQDNANLLRWTRSASGEAKQIYLSCEQYEKNTAIGVGNFPLEDKPVSLRVERRGDRIRMWATYDTSGWKMLLDRRCGYRETLRVGVFGLNVTEKDVEFHFENPYVLAEKKTTEDQ